MSTPNPGPHKASASETVSQSEVENLLAQVGGVDSPWADVASPAPGKAPDLDSAQRYHFREQSSLATGELRKLRLRHEDFIRLLAARLSIHFRLDVALQMSKLETGHFRKFIEVISNPTYLAMFQLEPLQGVCFLDIPPRMGLCFVNRELGGLGQCLEDARPLSEIESRLLLKIVEIVASEWCNFWRDLLDLRPAMLGQETSGDFVTACPPDTMMLMLGVQVQIGELSEQIQFCFPCATLAPLLAKLNSESKAGALAAPAPAAVPRWNPLFDNVKIKITARMPNLRLTTRDLAQLQPGNVLMLSKEMVAQAQLCLADKPKFAATVGNQNGCWAAKIVEALKS